MTLRWIVGVLIPIPPANYIRKNRQIFDFFTWDSICIIWKMNYIPCKLLSRPENHLSFQKINYMYIELLLKLKFYIWYENTYKWTYKFPYFAYIFRHNSQWTGKKPLNSIIKIITDLWQKLWRFFCMNHLITFYTKGCYI